MTINTTKTNLRIMYFNSNSIKGKLSEIKALNVTYQPDVISICETKIDSSFDDNELLGPTFTVTRKDRNIWRWNLGGNQ